MKGSVNNNKKTKHRCMLVKEIEHLLLFRKPSAFLFDKKKKKKAYKIQEMTFPSEQCLFSLSFLFYQI